MSTEGRFVRWVKCNKRYELTLPRGQHATTRLGASVEAWVNERGPCYITVGRHIGGNRFECVTPFAAPGESEG